MSHHGQYPPHIPPPPHGTPHGAPHEAPHERGVIWLSYALHFCAFFTGGASSVVAVIINYIKRNDQNLLMASHMQWQIDTFWRALAGCVVLCLVWGLLFLTVVGLIFIYPLLLIFSIWFAYRLIKGMLALNSNKPVV